jgi:hypothetical protein
MPSQSDTALHMCLNKPIEGGNKIFIRYFSGSLAWRSLRDEQHHINNNFFKGIWIAAPPNPI